jgi:Protein of unknown function (DUF3489)
VHPVGRKGAPKFKESKEPSGQRQIVIPHCNTTFSPEIRVELDRQIGRSAFHDGGHHQKALSVEGASLAELAELSGWKPNSVRGFLHGPALEKRGLALRSNKDGSGERRYFVDGGDTQ